MAAESFGVASCVCASASPWVHRLNRPIRRAATDLHGKMWHAVSCQATDTRSRSFRLLPATPRLAPRQHRCCLMTIAIKCYRTRLSTYSNACTSDEQDSPISFHAVRRYQVHPRIGRVVLSCRRLCADISLPLHGLLDHFTCEFIHRRIGQ